METLDGLIFGKVFSISQIYLFFVFVNFVFSFFGKAYVTMEYNKIFGSCCLKHRILKWVLCLVPTPKSIPYMFGSIFFTQGFMRTAFQTARIQAQVVKVENPEELKELIKKKIEEMEK